MNKEEKFYCCICGKEVDEELAIAAYPLSLRDVDFCCPDCYRYIIKANRINDEIKNLVLDMGKKGAPVFLGNWGIQYAKED